MPEGEEAKLLYEKEMPAVFGLVNRGRGPFDRQSGPVLVGSYLMMCQIRSTRQTFSNAVLIKIAPINRPFLGIVFGAFEIKRRAPHIAK